MKLHDWSFENIEIAQSLKKAIKNTDKKQNTDFLVNDIFLAVVGCPEFPLFKFKLVPLSEYVRTFFKTVLSVGAFLPGNL